MPGAELYPTPQGLELMPSGPFHWAPVEDTGQYSGTHATPRTQLSARPRRPCPHLKRGLAREALVDNGADAPQVCLPVIVLGHDDLRSLWSEDRLVLWQYHDPEQCHGADTGRPRKAVHSRGTEGRTMYMGEPHSVAAIMLLCR